MNGSPKYLWVKKNGSLASWYPLPFSKTNMAANWNLVGRNTIFKGSIFHSAMFAYLSDIPIISHPTSCLSGQGKTFSGVRWLIAVGDSPWKSSSWRHVPLPFFSKKPRSSPHFHHGHTSHARRRSEITSTPICPASRCTFPKAPSAHSSKRWIFDSVLAEGHTFWSWQWDQVSGAPTFHGWNPGGVGNPLLG